MIIKTAELSDTALDWAVATCIGFKTYNNKQIELQYGRLNVCVYPSHCKQFTPSTDWSQGGPIIEREESLQLKIWLESTPETKCEVHIHNYKGDWVAFGATPLIAAMRCYVASKLGDEVNVPDAFKNPT